MKTIETTGRLVLIKSTNPNESIVYVNSIGYIPYLVSKEKIKDGDCYYDKTINKIMDNYKGVYKYSEQAEHYAIIKSPRDFSDANLQDIVDEKNKNWDLIGVLKNEPEQIADPIQEVLEKNNLIAEFMQLPKVDGYENVYRINDGQPDWYSTEPKYNSSWDWLIPVCQKFTTKTTKIASWQDKVEYCKLCGDLDKHILYCEITPVFEHIVRCIKWYNEQNK